MYTKRNEFQLVFNLVENEIGDDLFGWFFVSENKKHAFGKNHLGDVIIFRLMIKQNDWEIFQIYFTKTWSFENKKVLKILRET